MIVSVGMGFTACTAKSSVPHVQHNDVNRAVSSRYMPVYQAQNRVQKPYVLMAQNNAMPKLRGVAPNYRHAPHNIQRPYYQDYQAATRIPYHQSQRAGQQRVDVQNVHHQLDESHAQQPRRVHHHLDDTATPLGHYPQRTASAVQSRVVPSSESSNYIAQQNEGAYSSTVSEASSLISTVSPNSISNSLLSARTQSPRLAIEELKIQEAQEALVQAKAQGRFKLNFDSSVGVSQSETDFNVIDRTDSDTRFKRAARLDLSLPLYQGGQIKAQKNVAAVGIKAAEANYEVVETAVTQETAIAHLNVIQDRQLIDVYTRNVELLKNQKQNVQAMVQAGENTVTDEALIDARLAAIEVRLEQAKADLAASESNYKKLVGKPAPALMPVGSVALPSSLQEIKEVARRNNAQVKSVESEAEAAFHNITLAKSFGKPKLSLQGILRAAEGQSETIRRDSAAELLLNLNVPILSGGENKSRVRQAALAQSRAVLETRELHDNLNERLEQLWARVQSARRSKTPNLAQKLAAQKAYEAITKQRNAGLATSLDVLSVEQTLLDAEINLLQAQNTEDVARFQLLGLMGAL